MKFSTHITLFASLALAGIITASVVEAQARDDYCERLVRQRWDIDADAMKYDERARGMASTDPARCALIEKTVEGMMRALAVVEQRVRENCPDSDEEDIRLARKIVSDWRKIHSLCLRQVQEARVPDTRADCGINPGTPVSTRCADGSRGCICLNLHNSCPYKMAVKYRKSGANIELSFDLEGNRTDTTTACSTRSASETITFIRAVRQ